MQHDLVWRDVFPFTNILHHLACQVAAFRFIDLPADDLAAEDIHKQVQGLRGRQWHSVKKPLLIYFEC